MAWKQIFAPHQLDGSSPPSNCCESDQNHCIIHISNNTQQSVRFLNKKSDCFTFMAVFHSHKIEIKIMLIFNILPLIH